MRTSLRVCVAVGLALSPVFVTAQSAKKILPADPFEPERTLVRQRKYEEAVKALETRMQSGDCRGAVCETNLSISLSRLQLTDHAVQEAQEAVNKINDEPSLSAWEANEVGVILFRAPKRNAKQLTAAAKAFRFARAHYSGRASNIAFNLAQTLLESGELSEAHTIQHELETRTLIDPNFAILGEFQGVSVERH